MFSILMLVEVIKQVDKTLDVINLGAEDLLYITRENKKNQRFFIMER